LNIAPVWLIEQRWQEVADMSGRSVAVVELDVHEMLASLRRRWEPYLWCVDLPRLTAKGFLKIGLEARDRGCELIVLDHVLRLRYGMQTLTAEVSDLATEAKELAKHSGMHVVLAAQIARPPQALGLSALLSPPRPDQLKQSGALEQEADAILLLHRAVRSDIDTLRLKAVREGRAEMATLFQPQVLNVTVGKHRLRSHLVDRTFGLWVEPWDEIIERSQWMREPGQDEAPPW
jgi:hypothetical protein